MSSQLDFWLGEWDCTWEGGRGTNTVTAELDGAVVLERFESVQLRGMSVSVYDADADLWRQTWVDSQRGYLELAGGFADGAMELQHERDGMRHRMRFTDIERDRFAWHWERLEGAEWVPKWQIEYTRR